MALIPRDARDPRLRIVTWALASLVPLFAYLTTLSGSSYWLDGGELTAAAVDLDIAHPPGHPLASLVAHALTLVPLGSLAMRAALAQALCACIAAGFFFSAIETTVRSLGVRQDRVSIPIALGATWLFACSSGWWISSTRPEVYALQTMLIAIAVERVVALEASWPTRDLSPLPAACLALGLSLANHHFMGFLCFPMIAPTLARVYRARGARPLTLSLSMIGVGLLPYLYLPIRAATDPAMNLGDPRTLSRFFWVVSAQAYQGTHAITPEPLFDRMLDVVIALVEGLSPVPVLLALAGAYALLRTPGAVRLGYVWLALVLFSFFGRGWLGFVRSNPDALGYLMPTMAGVAALAAALIAAVASALTGSAPGDKATPARPGLVALAVVVALLGLAQVQRNLESVSLRDFHATDDLDDRRLRSLPPRAIVIAHSPQTVFRYFELRATEHVRPDVTVVPMPFLAYPGMIDALVSEAPELRRLIESYGLDGELSTSELESLASRRPVLVELDVRVPLRLHESLLPEGLLYAVEPAGTTDVDRRLAAGRRDETRAALSEALARTRRDDETTSQLLWIDYNDALYFANVGELEGARAAVQRGLRLSPASEELLALRDALERPGVHGPIDVRPFVVGLPE
jgi:hypothetical protein